MRDKAVHVLITEDDNVISECVADILKREGFSVVGIVPTAEEAIEIAQSTVCDIVIMDINLKGKLTGIEAASAILSFNNKIEIVFVSAKEHSLVDFAVVNKQYEYVPKPFSNEQLLEAVTRCIERSKGST